MRNHSVFQIAPQQTKKRPKFRAFNDVDGLRKETEREPAARRGGKTNLIIRNNKVDEGAVEHLLSKFVSFLRLGFSRTGSRFRLRYKSWQ